MTLHTPRNLALQVLNRRGYKSIPVHNRLEDVFRRNPHLDYRDRAFITQLVQGVNRWRGRLDWIIEQAVEFPGKKISPPVLNILRLALFQIFFLDRVPESAAVNEAVNQTRINSPRHVVSFVNGILRHICRQKNHVSFPDPQKEPVHYLSVFYSYPEWLVRQWLTAWGRDVIVDLLTAGNRFPTLTIRTNRLRVARNELISRLADQGVVGKPTPCSPDGILLEDFRGRIDKLAAFQAGDFQVQDEAAQITSYLLNPGPGETVFDVCAGHGGKATHMAQIMGDKGEIFALDISHSRLKNLVQNSKRLIINRIYPIVTDASASPASLLRREADRIMVDAPCSGLGVLSRHPDGKWNKREEDIHRLAGLQKTIVSRAVTLLLHGGKMLYVTCTMSREENEGVVDSSLAGHRDLRLENLKDHVPEWGRDLIDDQGFLRTFPHKHHMDGFFAALFTKK